MWFWAGASISTGAGTQEVHPREAGLRLDAELPLSRLQSQLLGVLRLSKDEIAYVCARKQA